MMPALPKSEIRIPKSETNPKSEIPNNRRKFGISEFGFVSDFGIRISDFVVLRWFATAGRL